MLWVQPSPRYLEDGVQVSQRGPALPGVAHPLAVGVVLVGWHHIHRVVAKGPAAEGAAGQVGGLDAVTAGPLGGWVGTPAPLLHAQEGADGEAATAVGWGQIWDGQLGHCPCPGAGQVGTGWRGACQLYTLHNRSEVTGTHPPLMLIEERNQLEPPQAGQGEKIAGRDTKTTIMGITASQRLMGAAITDLRLSPKDRSAEKCNAEFASGSSLGTFSSHRDLLWKKGARGSKTPTHPHPPLGSCPRPVRSRKSSWLVSKMLPVALSWAGCGEGNSTFISQ